MSAIQTLCPKCGAIYMVGVVGSTPWPTHACSTGRGAMSDDGMEDGGVWEDRALAAEAEVRRLREALRKIANEDYRRERPWSATVAHEALEKP